ncbi:MAG: gfo/Idh/MocA family oxidoreductase [Acidobacteria bacterium]|nr:gfo/Idh/MocA family oxidoreductase [Acidobacteriota bacterium]
MPGQVRVGVVGVGSIGRHHVRILAADPGADLVAVFDTDAERAARIAAEHGTEVAASLDDLLSRVQAVSLAVPTPVHAEVGIRCIAAGCDLMVEKPLAGSVIDAEVLIDAARDAGRLLQVGHVERYNPAIEALLPRVDRPGFIEIHRLGTFVQRSLEVDVIADLMIHDIDIMHALVDAEVTDVRAVGIAVLSDEIDIANARLELSTGCIVNMTASRVSMNRVRKVRVFQPRAYFSVDYSDQSVACFRIEEKSGERPVISGDPIVVERGEPLVAELLGFLECVRTRTQPRVDGAAGLRAMRTALRIRDALTVDLASQLAPDGDMSKL